MPPVDLIDNLQVSRQQILEEVNGPALQSFRQNSVIGVGTGTNHDVPGLHKEGTETPDIIDSLQREGDIKIYTLL